MGIKEYISEVWPFKVDEVYIDDKAPFAEENINLLIAELFSENLDGEEDITGQAALAIQNLRDINQKKFNLIEKDAGKEVINRVFYDMFSDNYSENVSIKDYIKLFKEPSLKEIIFRQKKVSGRPFEFKEQWGDRNYRLLKGEKQILFELRTPVRFEDSFETNSRLGIKFEEKDLPDYKPSDKIEDYLKKVETKFPYPLKGETSWNFPNDKKVGSAITRYLPGIEWFSLDLRQGEFKGEHWSAFLSGLRDSGFIENDLEYFNNNQYILRKKYIFSAPLGEFELNNQRKEQLEDMDVIFSYNNKYTLPKLKMDGVRPYTYGDINPHLF